jgi:hypothetical protein
LASICPPVCPPRNAGICRLGLNRITRGFHHEGFEEYRKRLEKMDSELTRYDMLHDWSEKIQREFDEKMKNDIEFKNMIENDRKEVDKLCKGDNIALRGKIREEYIDDRGIKSYRYISPKRLKIIGGWKHG